MRRVLVTGANGFLGGHVVRQLLAQGVPVVATGRTRFNSPADCVFAQADLCESEQVADLFEQHDIGAVVHCAAYGVSYGQQDAIFATQVNVLATIRLYQLAEAAGAGLFVHVGSSYEYGDVAEDITEDMPLRPQGIYGTSKAAGSMMLQQLSTRGRLPAIIARVFGMFGPGEGPGKLIPLILDSARTGEKLDMTEGTEIRDYQYVGDVARQLAFLVTLAPDQASDARVLNLASGTPIAIRDLALRVAEQFGVTDLLNLGAIDSRADAVQRNVGDPRRFHDLARQQGRLDLLQPTPLAEALAEIKGAD